MKEKYAVIDSAYYNDGLISSIYHHLAYDHICGYSLGKSVVFFDSLEAAKSVAYPQAQSSLPQNDADRRKQHAVISFTCNDSESDIIDINKIYTVDNVHEEYHRVNLPGQPRVKVCVPKWNQKVVIADDMTAGALAELRKRYELRFYKQNPGRSLEYFVNESWVLPADKKLRAHTETVICEKLDKQFEDAHQWERVYASDLPAFFTTASGVSFLLTAGLLSYIASAAEAVSADVSTAIKLLTITGGMLTMFGAGAQAYNVQLNNDKRSFVRLGLFQPENQQKIKDAMPKSEMGVRY